MRRPNANHSKVFVADSADVSDLKDAVTAKLKMDIAPDRVSLLREVVGSAPVPLDSLKKLAEQGVGEGTCVLVEVMAPAPQLPTYRELPLLSVSDDPLLDFQGLVRNAELTKFARAVCSAQPGPLCAASGAHLWRLCDPTDPSKPLNWPFLNAHVLLERDFYAQVLLESKWLGGLSGKQRMLTVLGQPGIGKSAFGLWLLAHLLRTNRTVVYSRNFSKSDKLSDVKHMVFHRGVAFKITDLDSVDMLLNDPSVVHLCDSIKPIGAGHCHKVLITSPDPDVWRWFVQKEGAKTAYFPVASEEEVEVLRAAEFGDALPKETLALRMLAWGPLTRALFSPEQAEVGDDILMALSDVSLEDLQRAIREVRAPPTRGAASEIPHALFTLQANRETLRPAGVTFRSEAVAQRVMRVLAARNRNSLIPALQNLLASSSTRTVAGAAFELAATAVLGCGGGRAYRVLPLCTAAQSDGGGGTEGQESAAPWQALPVTTPVRRFGSLAELAQKCASGEWDLRSQYFKPTSPNLAAIDLIGPGLQLFQVTVNRASHELKVTSGRSEGEGLAALCRTLLPLLPERWEAQQPHLDVCFVVPEGCAKDWKAQKLVVHKPKASKGSKGPVEEGAAAGAVDTVQTQGGGAGFVCEGRVVEVRQSMVAVPMAVFDEWLALDAQPRDAIDLASES